MTNSPSSAAKDQFIVRFPDGMRDLLRQRAAANRRSMNAELLLLIERAIATTEIEPAPSNRA